MANPTDNLYIFLPASFATLPVQVRMEYVIMRNLDAAIKGQPKPGSFAPTAGRQQEVAAVSGLYCSLGKPFHVDQPKHIFFVNVIPVDTALA